MREKERQRQRQRETEGEKLATLRYRQRCLNMIRAWGRQKLQVSIGNEREREKRRGKAWKLLEN